MKLSAEYFRIRLVMLFGTLPIVFFIFMFFKIHNDYNYMPATALSDSSFVKKFSYYLGNDEKEVCLDIQLYNKDYRIRLRHTASKDWVKINDYSNLDQPIKYLYVPSQIKNDSILYDPSQLEINHKMIVRFEGTKRYFKGLMFGMLLFSFLFLCVFLLAFKTYKHEMYQSDRALWRAKQYKKLINRFLLDN
jgi:hypothetical protein